MSGLFPILIVIFILNAIASGNKNKKREQQKQAKQVADALRDPRQKPPAQPAKPQAQAAKAQAPKTRPAAQQVKIPFTQEEWKAYLRERGKDPSAGKAAAAPPPVQPILHPDDGYEGIVSTQGESDEEHAEHRRRIADEEARRRQARSELEELRTTNLEKLRAAVVMSEVLGKPVSLRPRGYRS